MKPRAIFAALFLIALSLSTSICLLQAQDMPTEYQGVLKFLDKSGDFKSNVLKINIPRNDVQVTVDGVATPTPFGFGGWLAMTKGDGGQDVMMGDLVLLESEVNPVLSTLIDNGIDVTAVHNHFFRDNPQMFFMHVMAHGSADDLARKAKPALDLIGKIAKMPQPSSAAPAATLQPGKIDASKLAQIVGTQGEQSGPVYKITVGRDNLGLKEMGAPINARMGLNSWAAFVGSDDMAAIAGDIAMLDSEVQPVLKALRKNNLEIVAIHHHMIGTNPQIIFLHYWGKGPADKLAAGFKAALDQLGKKPASMILH